MFIPAEMVFLFWWSGQWLYGRSGGGQCLLGPVVVDILGMARVKMKEVAAYLVVAVVDGFLVLTMVVW